jgi:hypothetical protein
MNKRVKVKIVTGVCAGEKNKLASRAIIKQRVRAAVFGEKDRGQNWKSGISQRTRVRMTDPLQNHHVEPASGRQVSKTRDRIIGTLMLLSCEKKISSLVCMS